jgi:prefoldin subunit 5
VPEGAGEGDMRERIEVLERNIAELHEFSVAHVKQLYDMLENINDVEQFLNTVEAYV